MATDPKATIKRALESFRGDDLYRARMAFKTRTPEQMQQPYGQSGQTCAQILEGYQQHDAAVNAALVWLESK